MQALLQLEVGTKHPEFHGHYQQNRARYRRVGVQETYAYIYIDVSLKIDSLQRSRDHHH